MTMPETTSATTNENQLTTTFARVFIDCSFSARLDKSKWERTIVRSPAPESTIFLLVMAW
jgi:hypothetical protein